MPNHVTTRVRIIASDELRIKIRNEIRADEADEETDESVIDFNKIAPMPKELENTKSPNTIISQEEYDEQEARIANGELSDFEKSYGVSRGITQEMSNQFIEKFGADNWYNWCSKNWGTKWNAYSQCNGDDDTWFEIQTAWSHPTELMQKLAQKYPDAVFISVYADEDIGNNCGAVAYTNDQVIEEYPDAEEAIAFAYAVQNGCDAVETIASYIEDEEDEESDYYQNMKNAIAILESSDKSSILALAFDFSVADVSFLTDCLE
jgi:hypothetical protein